VKLLGVYPGQSAPIFKAQTQKGNTVDLEKLRGEVVLIDYWASWCGPCAKELPTLRKAYKRFADRGFEIISISFDTEVAAMNQFAAREKMTWPLIWAEGGEESDLAKLYNISGIPATFLIGPDGKVIDTDLRGRKLLRRIEKQLAVRKHTRE